MEFTKSIPLGGPEQQLKPMASRPRSPIALSREGLWSGPREGLLEKNEGSKGLISPEVPWLGPVSILWLSEVWKEGRLTTIQK